MTSPLDSFSNAAKSYASHAEIQLRVARDLVSICPPSAEFHSAIDLGCGTGFVSSLLLAQRPSLSLDCLDVAPGMLAELESTLLRQGHSPRRLICSDARSYCGAYYDLVISSSALHWMEPIAETVRSWSKLCATGGKLGISCMVRGTLRELHEIRREEVPLVPPQRELPESQVLHDVINEAGFEMIQFMDREYRLELPDPNHLYRMLTRSGTAGGQVSRGVRSLNVAELRRIARRYSERYSNDAGSIFATYRVAFAVAHAR